MKSAHDRTYLSTVTWAAYRKFWRWKTQCFIKSGNYEISHEFLFVLSQICLIWSTAGLTINCLLKDLKFLCFWFQIRTVCFVNFWRLHLLAQLFTSSMIIIHDTDDHTIKWLILQQASYSCILLQDLIILYRFCDEQYINKTVKEL